TAAYAMGKHVPDSNLFPTVRTRSTTTKGPMTTRVSVNRTRMSTYLPTDRPYVYGRLHRTAT
ncbi:hypothetical protein V2W45_1225577, partial [Cenococcum geophilum]